MQLRQTIVWILAFLIAPLLILTIQIFPHFASVAIRAVRFHDTELLDDTLEWIELLFISYSMVTIGLITVFVWDALSFDRRDAMVLGPLPVRQATVAGAKLAALGAFLLLAAGLVTLPSGFLFAMETSDQLGALTFVTHLVAHLAATVGAAAFTFAAIVAFRGVVVILAGARAASAIGPLMQFLFVVLILSFVILTPAVWKIPHATLVNPTVTGWLPSSWFLGLFERVRGSSRAYLRAARHPCADRVVNRGRCRDGRLRRDVPAADAAGVDPAGEAWIDRRRHADPASRAGSGGSRPRGARDRGLRRRDARAQSTAAGCRSR